MTLFFDIDIKNTIPVIAMNMRSFYSTGV